MLPMGRWIVEPALRMTQIDRDIGLLWSEVFGEPPPITAAPDMVLDVLVRCLPLAPPYGELLPRPPDLADGTGDN